MPTVHFYTAPREWYRPIIVEEEEIYSSPQVRFPDAKQYFRTPGPFSVVKELEQFPAPFNHPALMTFMLDDGILHAQDVDKVNCPKVLFVGDTHHGEKCIEKRVKAALAYPWDLVVLEFKPSHLHWFLEAGVKNAVSLNYWNFNPRWHEPKERPPRGIMMGGQVGPLHHRRRMVLNELRRRGYPILHHVADQATTAQLYNESIAVVHVALNADSAYRPLEVIAAGGRCVQHYMNLDATCAVLSGILDRPMENYRETVEYQQSAKKCYGTMDFFTALYGAMAENKRRETRTICPNIWERIAYYETLQETHRLIDPDKTLRVGVPKRQSYSDLSDLPQFDLVCDSL